MTEPQRVIVTDVQIKFWSMVVLLVKSALASLPAFVILVAVAAGTISFLGSLSRVRESIFSITSSSYPPPASGNASLSATTTTKSGLQYAVLMTGSGRMPAASDSVTVHYRGTLVDGTEFDSSYKRGQPAVFPVNKVIPGWTEALQLMHEGDKWKLTIPPHLAYGDSGAGKLIPPNATLVFEVELLKVN